MKTSKLIEQMYHLFLKSENAAKAKHLLSDMLLNIIDELESEEIEVTAKNIEAKFNERAQIYVTSNKKAA